MIFSRSKGVWSSRGYGEEKEKAMIGKVLSSAKVSINGVDSDISILA